MAGRFRHYLCDPGLRIRSRPRAPLDRGILPRTGISSDHFWKSLGAIIHELSPEVRVLLEKRNLLQSRIDEWHSSQQGNKFDFAAYKKLLGNIGYLQPEGPDFEISTT